MVESRQRHAAQIIRQVEADLARSSLDRAGLSKDAETYRYYF
ncbi:MAG: hypothetical protein AAGL23_06255 [Pseudomonadota bacterium]